MNRPVVVLAVVFVGACWGLAAVVWGMRALWAADPWSLGALVVASWVTFTDTGGAGSDLPVSR